MPNETNRCLLKPELVESWYMERAEIEHIGDYPKDLEEGLVERDHCGSYTNRLQKVVRD